MQPYHSSTNQSSHLKSLGKYEHPEILMEQRILQSKWTRTHFSQWYES